MLLTKMMAVYSTTNFKHSNNCVHILVLKEVGICSYHSGLWVERRISRGRFKILDTLMLI